MVGRQPGVPVIECTIDRGQADPDRWPYTVPVVRQIWDHGLKLVAGMTTERGLYIFDEPESALSFDSGLMLLTLTTDMLRAGSQILLAASGQREGRVRLHDAEGEALLQIEMDGVGVVVAVADGHVLSDVQ